jgi:thiosulfate/3-mercaptopyruvate sulfurtransferase
VNPLIDDAELAVALASARPPTLLDVRWSLGGDGHQAYADGHIAGAVFTDLDAELGALNLPGAQVIDGSCRLLDPPALRARFVAIGLPDASPVGVYCGSGVVAAQTVLSLTVAGYQPVLYVGSWSHWITDSARPVER